jgi:hypothetical protein
MQCQTHNKQLQRTVKRRRGDTESAPFHYSLPVRFTRQRAADELRRLAPVMRMVSLAAFLVVAGLSVVWFANSWEFVASYEGVGHTVAVTALNAVAVVAAVALAPVGWRRQSRQVQASVYTTVFAVLWCALPFLDNRERV